MEVSTYTTIYLGCDTYRTVSRSFL